MQTSFDFDLPKLDLAQLRANPTLLLADSERDLLRRCALPRWFDENLYEAVLAQDGPETLTFAVITTHDYVEALPGESDRYQVRDKYRAGLLESWWPDSLLLATGPEIPPALHQLSEKLANYFAETAHQNDLERLYHLIAVDRHAASALFVSLFDDAATRFDLPRCHALTRVLEERQTLLGTSLAQLLIEKRQQLTTRSLWAQEYYETCTYFERAQTRSLFAALLQGHPVATMPAHAPGVVVHDQPTVPQWILHLYAQGGMGKTMFIRHTIAGQCIPQGVPCARIDFDFVPHVAEVAREPWRLLLSIAEQLNPQLPATPFAELLADHHDYIAQAGQRRIVRPRDPTTITDAEQERRRSQVIERFGATLAELWTERPLLLIFDTMENLRQRQIDLAPLFALLHQLHQRLPNLRLILSGRYDLTAPVVQPGADPLSPPDFVSDLDKYFADQYHKEQLQGFTPLEARQYLETQRGLTDDPRLDALVAKAGDQQADGHANPFVLALLADIVAAKPKPTTPAAIAAAITEIEQYPDANLAYLIERVVERIDTRPVRWLLRYGVIPRQLTLDFVQRVTTPYLSDVIRTGKVDEDDPQTDPLSDSLLKRQPFAVTTAQGITVDVDELWRTLYRFASSYSWVSSVAGVADTLLFHPDVVASMRFLLRNKRIYARLHSDAIRYYEERMVADPANRARWLREAVYHHYQLNPATADAYWHTQFDSLQDDNELVIALAEEVLYGLNGDTERIGAAVRMRASRELAYRLVTTHQPLNDDDQTHLAEWLQTIEQLNQPEQPVIAPGRVDYLRGQLQLARGDVASVLQTCEHGLTHPADGSNEIELRLLYADALTAHSEPDLAIEHLRRALDRAKADHDGPRILEVCQRLTTALTHQEEFEEADRLHRSAIEQALAQNDARALARCVVGAIQVNVALGREAEAVRLGNQWVDAYRSGSKSTTPATERTFTLARLRAEIHLAEQRPEAALRELDQFEQRSEPDNNVNALAQEQVAALLDLRARVATALLDVPTATRFLEQLAYTVYGPLTAQGIRCQFQTAQLHLELTGNWNEAARYLKNQHPTLDIEHRLLELHYRHVSRQPDQAPAILHDLLARPATDLTPSQQVAIAVEAVIQRGLSKEALQRLIAALERVPSRARRLVVLAGLQRYRPLDAAQTPATAINSFLQASSLRGDLYKLVFGEEESAGAVIKRGSRAQDPERDLVDLTLVALRQAEVERLLEHHEAAQRSIHAAESASRSPVRLTVLRAALLAHDRLGWTPSDLRTAQLPELKLLRELPFVGGLALLEQAERLCNVLADYKQATSLLAEASKLLGDPQSLWSARIARLRAQLAQASGDRATMHSEAERARTLFTAMGDQAAAAALEPLLTPPPTSPAAVAKGLESAAPAVVQVQIALPTELGAGVQVRYAIQSGETSEQTFHTVSQPEPLLQTQSNTQINDAFVTTFAQQWQSISRMLGELVVSPELRDRLLTKNQTYDLLWRTEDSYAAWVPWEFLCLEPEGPPFLLQPNCRYFFRNPMQPYHSLSPSSSPGIDVLVVRANAASQRGVTRGVEQQTGSSLKRIYDKAGLDIEEVNETSFEKIRNAVSQQRPRILHVAASIGERDGRLFLNFQDLKGQAALLAATDFGYMLQETKAAPHVVILDPPAPPTISECVRQLCLRNAFAAEVANMAVVPAILGTGLGDAREQPRLLEILIEALAEDAPVLEVARRLRTPALDLPAATWQVQKVVTRGAVNNLSTLLPYVGTALFTPTKGTR